MAYEKVLDLYRKQIADIRARIERDPLIAQMSAVAEVLQDRASVCGPAQEPLAITLLSGASAIECLIARDLKWKNLMIKQLENINQVLTVLAGAT